MIAPATIQSTWVEEATYDFVKRGEPRFLFHQGSSRSGKTYNICIGLSEYLAECPMLLSIVRATGPALKATVMRDMLEVLDAMGLMLKAKHSKTEQIITLGNGAQIEYFSIDDPQKVKGRKRPYLWCNEANELEKDDFRQLRLRTEKQIILDFNPSAPDDHWIWTYEQDERAQWYYSTFRDNPFLAPEQVREIEQLRYEDDVAWQIYGLGKRAVSKASIYQDVQRLATWPEHSKCVYGLDFGFNDPTVLVRVARRDANPPDRPRPELMVWTLVHESYLTTDDLIAKMRKAGIQRSDEIYCDGAEPDRIEMLRRAGFNAKPADKSKGSRRAGIDYCKRHVVCVGGPAGERAYAEIKGYRWKQDKNEVILDEPIETQDHAPDAMRYAALTHWGIPSAQTRHARLVTI